MTQDRPARPPWIGFVVGILVVALPVVGYLIIRAEGKRPKIEGSVALKSPSGSSVGAQQVTFPIDDTAFQPSGMSLPDEEGPVDPALVRRALARAEAWLGSFRINPFGGIGTDSLRLYALQVESYHRLWWAESDPARKAALNERVRRMLEDVLAADRLREAVRMQGSTQGIYEIILLCGRGDERGIDIAPVVSLIRSTLPVLQTEIDRMPPSAAAMYVASLSKIGIDVERPISMYRSAGLLSKRPREVTMVLRDVYALSQEILAYSDGGAIPLADLTVGESRYLTRVLPYFAMAYTIFHKQELVADLLSCLSSVGLTQTYGYREALRTLIARQNPDGSFGELTEGQDNPLQRFAATTGCITALCIESRRSREAH